MKPPTIAGALVLCILGAIASFGQDAFMGTWKLTERKSEFSPRAPKNRTVVYEAQGDKVKITVDSVSSDGRATH